MSFFDELGRKITDAGKAASEKAKSAAVEDIDDIDEIFKIFNKD